MVARFDDAYDRAPRSPSLDREAADRPQERHRAWRGWHVIGRFTPMVILGLIFIIVGVSPAAPHAGPIHYGPLLFWLGVVLIGAAIIGMLFTKCPSCYRSHWVMCYLEPDVLPDHGVTEFYRDLAPRGGQRWDPHGEP